MRTLPGIGLQRLTQFIDSTAHPVLDLLHLHLLVNVTVSTTRPLLLACFHPLDPSVHPPELIFHFREFLNDGVRLVEVAEFGSGVSAAIEVSGEATANRYFFFFMLHICLLFNV